MAYNWDFNTVLTEENLSLLASGAWMTVKLSSVSIVIGTVGGVALGALATVGSPSFAPLRPSISTRPGRGHWGVDAALKAVRVGTLTVIDVVRAIPLLLMVLLIYYSFPVLFPAIDKSNVFLPCAVAFSINLASFVGELVRAGVVALPPGAVVAARALGMTPAQTWIHIVLPQIARDILPAQVVLCITIIKMSTLASVVALYEVLHSGGNIIQRTYRPLEVYVLVGLFFVALIVPLALLARRLETASIFRRREL